MPLGRNLVHEIADGSFHVAGKFDRQSPSRRKYPPDLSPVSPPRSSLLSNQAPLSQSVSVGLFAHLEPPAMTSPSGRSGSMAGRLPRLNYRCHAPSQSMECSPTGGNAGSSQRQLDRLGYH